MLPDYRIRQRDYLLEIGRALTAQLNLNDVLQLILRFAADMLNSQFALIALIEPDGSYRIRQAYAIPQQVLDLLTSRMRSERDTQRAVRKLEEDLIAIARDFGLGYWQVVSLPLTADGDQFLGAIHVFRMRGGSFSANDRHLLQAFADQAAIAVKNARLYERLTQEQQRLEAILRHSAEGLVIMDAQHRILSFNRTMAQLTGISEAQAKGQRFESLLSLTNKRSGHTLEEAEAGGWPIVGADKPLLLECDLRRNDGKLLSVEIAFVALFNQQNHLLNIIAHVHDLTRFRLAEEMKNTFISAVSHELKTPVALIKGYAETLRRQDAHWDQQTIREGLGVISEEADHLAELIDNLLSASRAQAGSFKLTPVELDLDELVLRAVKKWQTQHRTHQFVAALSRDLPLVLADEARISQVLNNLLSNAVKYSPEGSTIRVDGCATSSEVVICVSDEGPGIPPEEQARIFDRFYRSPSAVQGGKPGTGLGLYLTRAIVEAHGGRIWVESDGTRGSKFCFSLPRSRGDS